MFQRAARPVNGENDRFVKLYRLSTHSMGRAAASNGYNCFDGKGARNYCHTKLHKRRRAWCLDNVPNRQPWSDQDWTGTCIADFKTFPRLSACATASGQLSWLHAEEKV